MTLSGQNRVFGSTLLEISVPRLHNSSPSRHVRVRKLTLHFTTVRLSASVTNDYRIVNSIAVLSEDRFLLRGELRGQR